MSKLFMFRMSGVCKDISCPFSDPSHVQFLDGDRSALLADLIVYNSLDLSCPVDEQDPTVKDENRKDHIVMAV